MDKRERGWDERVRQIEAELSEKGPSETDDRKVRFLMAAYLRDIRDQLRKASGVATPRPGSKWDVEQPSSHDDDGDTRPFAFIDELRMPRKSPKREAPAEDDDEDDEK